MLLHLVFDDAGDVDDGSITAAYEVGRYVVQLKQKPGEGHEITPGGSKDVAAVDHNAYPNVGLMVWQSAFALAEHLLREPPCASWKGVSVVELGCGVGVLGIALGMAGAKVKMTDLGHITPLAQENADMNRGAMRGGEVEVVTFPWGEDPGPAGLLPPPDYLVAADVLYEPQYYDQLLDSLVRLCAPHTLVYLCYRHRGSYREETFEAMAAAAGFCVEKLPDTRLGAQYQGLGFQLYKLRRGHLAEPDTHAPAEPEMQPPATTATAQLAQPDTQPPATAAMVQLAQPDTQAAATTANSQLAEPETQPPATAATAQLAQPDTQPAPATTATSQVAQPDVQPPATTA